MTTTAPVVGSFARKQQADEAIAELRACGLTETQLGYLAPGEGPAAVEHKPDDLGAGAGAAEGAAVGGTTGLVAGTALGLAAMAGLLPPFGPALAGGALVALMVGGGAAAMGGLVGFLMGQGLSEEEARCYEEHFRQGRVIVTVSPGNQRARALEVLRRHGAELRPASW